MSETSSKYYRPNAAVIVTDGQGNVLLCHRAEVTYQTVQTVQGGIDAGETAEQAARRELKEELGITDNDFFLVGQAPGLYRYEWPESYRATLHGRASRYIGQEQAIFLVRVPPDITFNLDAHYREFSKVHWGKPQDLVDQAWEGKKPGLEAALRHFGLI